MDYPLDFDAECTFTGCSKDETHKHIWGNGSPSGCYLLKWDDDDLNNALVIVEGEKAAAALQSYALNGYTPVSYRGGWNAAVNANYAAVEGRKVIVWSDNDKVGLEAGLNAAQKSIEAGAASVRICDVSALGKKADAADVDGGVALDLLLNAGNYDTPHKLPSYFDETLQLTQLNAADYAERFLPAVADRLLISMHRDMSGRDISQVWLCNESGIWRRPEDELKALIRSLIERRVIEVFNDTSMPQRAKDKEFKYLNRAKDEQIGNIVNNFASVRFTLQKSAPDSIKGLTLESGDKLDDNTRYLGAPNGVIDLHTGKVANWSRRPRNAHN